MVLDAHLEGHLGHGAADAMAKKSHLDDTVLNIDQLYISSVYLEAGTDFFECLKNFSFQRYTSLNWFDYTI